MVEREVGRREEAVRGPNVGEHPERERKGQLRREERGEGKGTSEGGGGGVLSLGGESCRGGCSSGVVFNLFCRCCCCFVQELLGFLAKVMFNS